MNKTKIIPFILGTVFGMLGGYIGFTIYYHYMTYIPEPGPEELREIMKKSPQPGGLPGYPSLLYPADPADDHILLGASHNVFIGKVLAQTGNKETEIGPRTQYQVQVIDNIKGNLSDVVIVDMLGGYNKEGKPVFVEEGSVAGEDPLFQSGTTYLFATRYNAQENWYTVIAHPNARTILSKDTSLPTQTLRALAERDEKVKKFEAAYVLEIPDKADIANNNTRNAFQSLPPEAKAAAVARADAARASLGVNAE